MIRQDGGGACRLSFGAVDRRFGAGLLLQGRIGWGTFGGEGRWREL